MRQSTIAAATSIGNRKYMGAGELRLWALVIVAVAYWANIIRGANTEGGLTIEAALNSILDEGAFDVFAWALVLVRACVPFNGAPATRRQIAAAALSGIIVMIPARLPCAAALVVLGLVCFTDPRLPPATRQIRLVLFALAFETVWMSPLLAPVHVLAGGVDAWLVTALLHLAGQAATYHANFVDNASSGFGIAIWPYCASSFPLADVALAFLVTVLYRNRTLRRSHLSWLGLSFIASVTLTELRLAIMAINADSYHWWHFGPGVTVYTLAALGSSVAFPLFATSRSDEAEDDTIARAAA